jgi:hypothetical protein
VNWQEYFSHQSYGINFFPTPPIKLKLGLQIGGRLVIANHLDQSETGSGSQIVFINSSLVVIGFAVPFTSLSKLCKNA